MCLVTYLPRWFTRPQTVTHPSTKRAQCRLTTLIEANALTTIRRHHDGNYYHQIKSNPCRVSLIAQQRTEIIFDVFGIPTCVNVTVGRTDDLLWLCGIIALCVASRGKKCIKQNAHGATGYTGT